MDFDENQPRDEIGQWTAGDAGSAIKSAASDLGKKLFKKKTILDLKVGGFIQTKPPESLAGTASGGGGLYGKVLKINPKSVEIETEYGGWGGKEPIKQIHKVKKEQIIHIQ